LGWGCAVKRKTMGKKFRAVLGKIGEWCKKNRHAPMEQQHRELSAQMRGHYTYYGVRGNHRALACFYREARRLWHYWLSRRSREKCDAGRLWQLLDEHFGHSVRTSFGCGHPLTRACERFPSTSVAAGASPKSKMASFTCERRSRTRRQSQRPHRSCLVLSHVVWSV
jgi:hypothetical protein